MLDKEVEDFVRVRSLSTEYALPEWFGGAESLKALWVCITDDFEYLGPDGRHLVFLCDSEEG